MARTITQTVMERMKHTKEIMSNNASPPFNLFIFIGTKKAHIKKINNEVANKIQPQVFKPFIQSYSFVKLELVSLLFAFS